MSNLFDVVNEHDEITGQATLSEIRDKRLYYRIVHNWVVNARGEYLFQFRAEKNKSLPRRFDASSAGKVDAGETYDEAVLRESREELGLIAITPQPVRKILLNVPMRHSFIQTYFTYHDGPFTNWEHEADALEWMSFSEFQHLSGRFPYLFCETETLPLVHNYLQEHAA